jgi:hypothetical protein
MSNEQCAHSPMSGTHHGLYCTTLHLCIYYVPMQGDPEIKILPGVDFFFGPQGGPPPLLPYKGMSHMIFPFIDKVM